MSRAVNINASVVDVSAACQRQGLTISAIETLASGGTRVVLMNGTAADLVRRAFGKRVLTDVVQRTPLRSWARQVLSRTGTRTISSAVTFNQPFKLGRDPRELPLGVYRLHTVEEVYEGAFDPLYQAVIVELEVPQRGGRSIRIIRPEDLTAALKRDQAQDEVIA